MTPLERLDQLQERIGHRFANPTALETAMTHKSFANERGADSDNERMEFLGDAVLDLALSDVLMRLFPTDPEGGLSKKRASLVNEDVLSKLALELRLEDTLKLGRGEMKTGGVFKPRILASSFEAMIGAVFLDGGFEKARGVVERLFESKLSAVASSDIDFREDFKTRLQERVQEAHRATPVYKVETESGPDHDKQFEVSVRVGERVLGTGVGRSKKSAEQDAARAALEKMA